MVAYPDRPRLELLEPYWYELKQDYQYTWETPLHKHRLIIKKGFQCDLASVPKFLWSVISPQDLTLSAPLVHDVIYACQGDLYNYDWAIRERKLKKNSIYHPVISRMDRKTADQLFYEQAVDEGVSKHKALPAYYILRLTGNYAWLKTRAGDEKYS